MIINKLNLRNFGKFENKELEFGNGLNIIYGENEAGKSTVSTALKTWFYTEHSAKNKYKRSYIPLSESKGTFDVHLTLDSGNKIESLVTLGKTNAKTSIRSIDSSTGSTINMEGQPGEHFFKMSEETYDSVCYIKDIGSFSDMTANKESVHDELSKNNNEFVDIDLTAVIENVRSEQLAYQRKTSTGKIYPVQERLNEVNSELYNLADIQSSIKTIEEKITNTKELLANYESEIKALKEKKEYSKKYKDYQNTKRQLKIRDEINSLKEKKESYHLDETEIPDEDFKKIKAYSAENLTVKKLSVAKPVTIGFMLILLGIILSFTNILLLSVSLFSVICFIYAYKAKLDADNIKAKKAESDRLLEKYNISSIEEYNKKREEYLKNINEINLINQKIEFLNSEIAEYNKEFEGIYLDEPEYGEEEILQLIEIKEKDFIELKINLNKYEEQKKNAFNNLPDINQLEKEKEELEAQLCTLKEEENIINDTLKILKITNDSFKASYIPYLNKEVSEILNGILDIDYFNIDDKLHCEVRKKDSNDILSRELLSSGTDDLIYFALRLAIYKFISKEEKIPLILDDCFIELDDIRYAKIMDYLSKNFENQIIYFTAHKRIFNLTLANTTVIRL